MSENTSHSVAKELEQHPILATPFRRWERVIAWISDRSSPIVVKELRQSLKSRQFVWTLMLLLLAIVLWSFLGVSIALIEEVSEFGRPMLTGYVWILGFPLMVIVPFSAFRSLAREFEEETIQLVGITTMEPRRIITGKLLSALVQLVIYLAAAMFCMAFTYLLGGIDLTQIGGQVGCMAAVSMGSICLSLAFAGLGKNPLLRVANTLLLIIGLFIIYFSINSFLGFILLESWYGDVWSPDQVLLTIITLFTAGGYLMFQVAGSLISFPASNRSSRVRFGAIVFHVAIMAAMFVPMLNSGFLGNTVWFVLLGLFSILIVSAHFWFIVGSLMVAEQGGLSERVRRSLPRNVIGKSLLSLYFPGPGRGYLFALSQMLTWPIAVCIAFIVVLLWMDNSTQTAINAVGDFAGILAEFCLYNFILGAGYLSIVFLICRRLRHRLGRFMAPIYGLITGIIVYALATTFAVSTTAFLYYQTELMMRRFPATMLASWPSILADPDPTQTIFERLDQPFVAIVILLLLTLVIIAATFYAVRELNVKWLPTPQRVHAEPVKHLVPKHESESFEDIISARDD